MSDKLIASTVLAIALELALIGTACFLPRWERGQLALTLAIIICGMVFGWLFGILITPYSEREGRQFATYASIVGAFLSGYVVAKVDRLVDALLNPELLLQPTAGFRAVAFGTSFIISMLLTFSYRQYAPADFFNAVKNVFNI